MATLQYAKSPKAALKTLQSGIKHSPQAHTLRLLLARAYQTLQQPKLALSALTEYQPDIAFNEEYYALQGSLAQQLNEHDTAYRTYYLLVAYQPKQSQWWLGLAVALDQQQNYPDALKAYRKAQDFAKLSPSVSAFVQQRISQIRN